MGGRLTAVAVEPVAASLGASKGSVFWHRQYRAALLTAALELREHDETEQVITELGRLDTPPPIPWPRRSP